MQTTQYPGDIHALLKWAVNRHDSEPPEPYKSWVRSLFPENCRAGIGYHVGVYTADTPTDGDWQRGYPHAHIESVDWPPDTFTAVTYLTVADDGGEFALGGLDRDDPYELLDPEPGLTVCMTARHWHGVKPIRRGTRLALVTSGPPR